MNRFYRKLRAFIFKDVSNERETRGLAVLLRVLSACYVLYFLFVAISMASLFYYMHAFVALIFAGILVGCFVCTYDNQTKLALKIFHAVTISATIYFTLFTGWSMNFQWNILITILVLFYSLDISMKKKLRYMKFLFTLILALSVFTHMMPSYREGNAMFQFIFQTLHAVFYGVFLCTLAYCYCNKFNLAETKLRQFNQKLVDMASIDALTKLANRRSMNEHLSLLVYENTRAGKPFCIAIADVDFFKKINDSYGHDAGDYVLTTLAEIFQSNMKGRGKVARWGGEEFLFSFEGMNVKQARNALELLRLQIEKHNFTYKDQTIKVTMTIGLEEYSQIIGIEATISKADQKLYNGKQNGRNQVVS